MLTTGPQVRRAEERGTSKTDWLESRHSFSFAEYRDEKHMGIGPLRVLNDDRVAPGMGFGPHAHRDMEIVSYVLEGAMAHHDSAGNEGVVKAGEAQFMRAGTGVVHSEMNASKDKPLHFLQIWLTPRTLALKPLHEHRKVTFPERGGWAPIVGAEMGGFAADCDALLLTAKVAPGQKAGHVVHAGRQAYLFVIRGTVALAGEKLHAGDAALLRDGTVGVKAQEDSHVLLFDLPQA